MNVVNKEIDRLSSKKNSSIELFEDGILTKSELAYQIYSYLYYLLLSLVCNSNSIRAKVADEAVIRKLIETVNNELLLKKVINNLNFNVSIYSFKSVYFFSE